MLKSGENTVTLTAEGHASAGYCKIVFGNTDNPYYTSQFPNPEEQNSTTDFIFRVKVSEDTEMTVIPNWGSYVADGKQIIDSETLIDLSATPTDGQDQLGSSTPPQDENAGQTTYMVENGDSLWKIAQRYDGISAEDIAAYNGIKDPSKLQIGAVLQIPPPDYQIVVEPDTSSPPPTESKGKADDPVSSELESASTESTASIPGDTTTASGDTGSTKAPDNGDDDTTGE